MKAINQIFIIPIKLYKFFLSPLFYKKEQTWYNKIFGI